MRKTATLLEQSLRRAKDTTTLHYEGEIKRGSSRRTVAGREAGGTCHQVIRIIRRGDFPAPEALKSTATPQPPHHRPAAIPPLPLSASLSSGGAARFAQRPARAPACPPRLSPHCACAGRPHEETAPPSAAGLRRAPRHVGPARQAHLPHRRQRRCRGWDAVGGPQRGPASPFSAPVSPGRVGFSGLRAPGGRLPPPSPPFPGVQRPRCVAVPLPAGSLCPLLCGVPRVLHFFFFFWHACARDARLQAWISAVRDESPRLRCAGGRGFAHAAPAPVPAPAWRPGAPVFHSCSSATRTCLLRSTQAAELPLGVYTWRKPNSLSLLPSL